MLRTDDLIALPDFRVGRLAVSPSRRTVASGGEATTVEPRVMQVLVLLAREAGSVVTRQRLFSEVWGGVPVGDDSLNRAIAGARRAFGLDPDLTLETIPRTGYRLNVPAQRAARRSISRRQFAAGTGVMLAAGSGLGVWFYQRSQGEQAYSAAMARGRDALAYGDSPADMAQHFRQAANLRPNDPGALGLLAFSLALRADSAREKDPAPLIREAEVAKLKALELDPGEPNARLAGVVLQRPMLDFAGTEDRLQAILRSDPRNIGAMKQYWNLLQCVGRSREALAQVERSLRVAPLAAASHYPRAQLLWITGRSAEADRVIERAFSYWPQHRWVRFARFTILAFSGRPAAARAMLDDPAKRPQGFSPEAVALWHLNLAALEHRSPHTIAAARDAGLEQATRNLQLASTAVLTLSEVGELDPAFEVTSTLFAAPIGEAPAREGRGPVRSTAWRFAPWLFTPPLAAMRDDPRFDAVCDAAGLVNYWSERRIVPDYRLSPA